MAPWFSFGLLVILGVLARPTLSQNGVEVPVPDGAKLCRSGAQLAAAFADPEVTLALVPDDIALKDSDWAGHDIPILLQRNFTISGTASLLVTLDMAFLRAKVNVANGMTLTFHRVVLINYRAGSWHQAPGFDLVMVPMPANEKAYIHLYQSAFVIKACFSLSLAMQASAKAQKELPGNNTYILPDALPANCTNSTAAPTMERCYAYAGRYLQVTSPSSDVGPNGNPMPNGYVIRFTDTQVLCAGVLSDECVARLGPIGCVLYTLSQPSPPPDAAASQLGYAAPKSTLPTVLSGAGQGAAVAPLPASESGGSDATKRTLIAVLASVLGGLLLVGGVVALVLLVRRRRRRQGNDGPHFATPASSVMEGGLQKKGACVDCELASDWGRKPARGADGGKELTKAPDEAAGGGVPSTAYGMTASRMEGEFPIDGSKLTVINFAAGGLFGSPSDGVNSQSSALGHVDGSAFLGSTPVITPATPQRAGLQLNVRMMAVAAGSSDDSVRTRGVSSSSGSAFAPGGSTGGMRVPMAGSLGAGRMPSYDSVARGGAMGNANSNVVTLLPIVLGKGAFGRVYEGTYQGARVAVKVVLESAFGFAGSRPAPSTAASQKQRELQQQALYDLQGKHGREGSKSSDDMCCASSDSNAAIGAGQNEEPGNRRDAAAGRVIDQEAPDELPGELPDMSDGHHIRHFQQEVEVLGRCQHPNVVSLLAACLTPPRMCLVMELMETSLERLIFGGGLIPLPKLLHIAVQVGQGLEYLHPTIIHRDLKPANVLINGGDSPTPVAKLTDFGLSRLRAATMPTMHPDAGTPAYLAPECYDLRNDVVTHHADMYALGVLLWAMLTGQEPWKDHSVVAVAYKVTALRERLPLEHLSDRRCPPKLKQLIRQCWEQDPRRRPAAAEVVKELQELQTHVRVGGGASIDGDSVRSRSRASVMGQQPESSVHKSGLRRLSSSLSEAALIEQLNGVELEIGNAE